jgi:hypothetical protein
MLQRRPMNEDLRTAEIGIDEGKATLNEPFHDYAALAVESAHLSLSKMS